MRNRLRLSIGACARGVLFAPFLAVSLLVLPFFASPSMAGEKRCSKARHLAGIEKPLPKLHNRIVMGETIRIVAIGSSSTEGTPADDKSEIYPAVLGRMLSREILTPVEVINKGRGGETIPLMLARLERDVIALRPDLVVWQLGVNDVIQMDGIEGALSDMRIALQRLRQLDLPVVLVDLQVAPAVDRDVDTPAMQAAITEAARAENVMHFHRYEIMKNLVASREAEMTELVRADGLHMTPLAHLCTGQLLAGQIAKSSLLAAPASRAPIQQLGPVAAR